MQDALFAAAFTVLGFLPPLAASGVLLGELPVHRAGPLAAALALAQCLPLAIRRRLPALCLAIVACAFAAYQLLAYPPSFSSVGLLLALYAAGAHEATFRRKLALGATASYVVLAIALEDLGSAERPVDYVAFYLALAACWGAGALIRGRQAREGERRRRAAAQATADERTRIARELHDVVTQHVTGMVVQADAGQFLLTGPPDLLASGLTEISATGRRALGELRYLQGVLDTPDGEGEPAAPPSGERLRDLVEQARRAGQPADLIEKGEPEAITASAEFAAYRVVQEALTNAVKHAPGRPTLVVVRHGDGISIEVTTEGPAIADGSFVPGRGLSGLRERVHGCGGDLEIGGQPGGGFRVYAQLPARPGPP